MSPAQLEADYSAALSMAAHYQGIADEAARYGEWGTAALYGTKANAERDRASAMTPLPLEREPRRPGECPLCGCTEDDWGQKFNPELSGLCPAHEQS